MTGWNRIGNLWLGELRTYGEAGQPGWGQGQEAEWLQPQTRVKPVCPMSRSEIRPWGGGCPVDLPWVTCHQEDPARKRGEFPRKIGVLLPQNQNLDAGSLEKHPCPLSNPGHGGHADVHPRFQLRTLRHTEGRSFVVAPEFKLGVCSL